MNEPLAIGTILIIVVTTFCSWRGFRDSGFRERHLFSVREILAGKQYHRLFTSAFLHADWNHLALNMLSLYLFGRNIELLWGVGRFLLIYFVAIVGGDLLSLWIHRQHEYRAYGASGGVCGVIFSFIFLFPGSSIGAFFLPIMIPGWLYAIGFFIGSFFALKRQADNIGHDAHLGGAILGLWTTATLEPSVIRLQPKLFATITILSVLLFLCFARNPLFLTLGSFPRIWPSWKSKRTQPASPRRDEAELDAILEKISASGIDSLNPEEKARLESTSETYRRRAESRKPDSDLII